MKLFFLPLHYLWWHYTLAWRDIISIYRNFLWFVIHFFSIPLLLKTWIAPWRRLGEVRRKGFDLGDWFGVLIVNALMRLVGFVARAILIFVGLTVWIMVAVSGLVFMILWLVLPILVAVLLIVSIYFFTQI